MTARLLSVLLLCAALAAPVAAQKDKQKEDPTVRSVEGTVTDELDNPLSGAVVQLKNVKTLQIRSFITQSDGKYYFQGLNTNVDYELRASHNGRNSAPKTLSSFDSRKRAIINLKVQSKK